MCRSNDYFKKVTSISENDNFEILIEFGIIATELNF